MDREYLHSGASYDAGDPDLLAEQQRYQDRIVEYNSTLPSQTEERLRMLHEMLADCGDGVCSQGPPLNALRAFEVGAWRKL